MNAELDAWISEIVALCQPQNVHIVDGSEEEANTLIQKLIASKTFTPLQRPGSYLARSNPDDVARVEERTFICSERQEDAGPTNNWRAPKEMRNHLIELFQGCMQGRTMYVVPYCMGPLTSPWAKVAVEITDSPYVVVNMRLMAHVGKAALEKLGASSFVRCLHSVGQPLRAGAKDVSWPCNPQQTTIAHFPETGEVMSFGSGYGGNALLNKKCFALRLASCMARQDGWLAEHMLIIGVTNPEGEKKYFAAAFPSACGKTNLAMLTSKLSGWKVECVGDDIAWMHWGEDGRLYAINPEAGFFGVAPGTSMASNPVAMKTIERNTIFTNVALTDDGNVWWEGIGVGKGIEEPQHLISWKGVDWTPASSEKAAHPNSRFTVSISECPILDPSCRAPHGVPISGIIFGGRRSTTIPLVRQAKSWQQGVFFGASMTSETTAAAKGEVGKVRHDPFAMLPFCGYNMGDYFAHWLAQEKPGRHMPAIFYVNWFLKDSETGAFLWPGYSENMRVLRWMFDRIDTRVGAEDSPFGYLPCVKDIARDGKESEATLHKLLSIDKAAWHKEATELQEYFKRFGNALPDILQSLASPGQ